MNFSKFACNLEVGRIMGRKFVLWSNIDGSITLCCKELMVCVRTFFQSSQRVQSNGKKISRKYIFFRKNITWSKSSPTTTAKLLSMLDLAERVRCEIKKFDAQNYLIRVL